MARLAKALGDAGTLLETLTEIAAAALDVIDGCEMAGVMVLRPQGRLDTAGATHPAVEGADQLQRDLAEGPCLDAAARTLSVRSDDVSLDPRWPRWGPAAASRYGVRGMLSVQLVAAGRVYGALNLYSTERYAYDEEATAAGTILGVHAAIALRGAVADQDLARAVDSRTVIGQAQGILMERLGVSDEQSLAVLRRLSQNANRRLVEVARELTVERSVAGLPPSRASSGR